MGLIYHTNRNFIYFYYNRFMETEKGIEFYFAILTGMLAFGIIAVGVVIFFIRYQKRLLLQQNELHNIELQHKEDLLISNIQSVEEERRRIAKDIHDELGGIFSTLALAINQIKTEEVTNKAVVQESRDLINTGLKSVRRISHAVMPDELELFGLHSTLENYSSTISRSTGIEIEYTSKVDTVTLKPVAELALYRIIQELISNTLKHANATKIAILFTLAANEVIMEYKDNGNGFTYKPKQPNSGMGMKNLEGRLLVMHGTMELTSAPNKGFACTMHIPLTKNILV
jgi:two-component system, NarL family, sensor kinase